MSDQKITMWESSQMHNDDDIDDIDEIEVATEVDAEEHQPDTASTDPEDAHYIDPLLPVFTEMEPFADAANIYKHNKLVALMDLIGAELAKLPVTQRKVIYGYYYRGQSLPEIATELGIGLNNVKQRKIRGMHNLKKALLNNPYVLKLYAAAKSDPTIAELLKICDFLDKNP